MISSDQKPVIWRPPKILIVIVHDPENRGTQHVRNETNGLRKPAIMARADSKAYSDRTGVLREHGTNFRGGQRNDEGILDVSGQGQRRHF